MNIACGKITTPHVISRVERNAAGTVIIHSSSKDDCIQERNKLVSSKRAAKRFSASRIFVNNATVLVSQQRELTTLMFPGLEDNNVGKKD